MHYRDWKGDLNSYLLHCEQEEMRPDLSGMNFENGSFSGAELTYGDLNRTTFENYTFENCVFDKSFFTGADFTKCTFTESTFAWSAFDRSEWVDCEIRNSRLSGVRFCGADIRNLRVNGGEMAYMKFARAKIKSSVFATVISGARFTNAEICGVAFSDEEVYNMEFRQAELIDTSFHSTLGAAIDFRGARMDGVVIAPLHRSSNLVIYLDNASGYSDSEIKMPESGPPIYLSISGMKGIKIEGLTAEDTLAGATTISALGLSSEGMSPLSVGHYKGLALSRGCHTTSLKETVSAMQDADYVEARQEDGEDIAAHLYPHVAWFIHFITDRLGINRDYTSAYDISVSNAIHGKLDDILKMIKESDGYDTL